MFGSRSLSWISLAIQSTFLNLWFCHFTYAYPVTVIQSWFFRDFTSLSPKARATSRDRIELYMAQRFSLSFKSN